MRPVRDSAMTVISGVSLPTSKLSQLSRNTVCAHYRNSNRAEDLCANALRTRQLSHSMIEGTDLSSSGVRTSFNSTSMVNANELRHKLEILCQQYR